MDIGHKTFSNVIKNYLWELTATKNAKEIRSGFVSLARLNLISQAHSFKKLLTHHSLCTCSPTACNPIVNVQRTSSVTKVSRLVHFPTATSIK